MGESPNQTERSPATRQRKRGLFGIVRYLFRYPIPVLVSVGLLLVNLTIEMTLPQLVGAAITRYRDFQETGQPVPAGSLVAWFVGLVLLRMTVGMILGPIRNRLVQRTLADIRSAIYDAMQRLSFLYHDRMNTGELISRSTSDAWKLQDFLFACLFLSVDIAVALVVTVVLIFRVHPALGAITLGTLAPTVGLVAWYAAKLQPKWREVHDLHGAMTTVIQENIAGVRVVKAFARESSQVEKFRGRRDIFLATLMSAVNYWAARVPLTQFLFGLSVPLVLWTGGRMVIGGQITVGELTMVILYLMAIGHRLGAIGQFSSIVQNASAAAERILEVVDEPRTIVGGTRSFPAADPRTASTGLTVRFENVSFGYAPGNLALDAVSFDVPAGQTVAVVGSTGAGKSTLVSLIPRFQDASAGRVLVGGADVRELQLEELRRAVGVVFQETFLFSATVAENISLGNPGATPEQIESAARAAAAHEFIQELENGYATIVGERGVTLSGGQKQRLAIARAFLLNPRILILDDATASVDAETEHRIQDAMRSLARGRTTFIIAHRLSSMRHAGLVLVLDRGRLVAQGTHDELASTNPAYRAFWETSGAIGA